MVLLDSSQSRDACDVNEKQLYIPLNFGLTMSDFVEHLNVSTKIRIWTECQASFPRGPDGTHSRQVPSPTLSEGSLSPSPQKEMSTLRDARRAS